MDDILKAFFGALMSGAGTTDGLEESLQFRDPSNVLSTFIDNIWGYFAVLAIGLTLIYFLMEMNTKYALEGRDMNFKTMFTPFLKLMIAIAVISQGAYIINALIAFHNNLIVYATDHFQVNPYDLENEDKLNALISSMGFFTKIFVALVAFLMWLVQLVCGLVWGYKALMYKLEYLFRICITPVALADIYSGNNSNAVKWIKGFLGLTLYGMAFIVIIRLGNTTVIAQLPDSSDFLEIIGAMAKMLIVPIAELGVLGAIKSMCKEAVG